MKNIVSTLGAGISKNSFLLFFMAGLLSMSAKAQDFTFDDLDYAYEVKKISLPQAEVAYIDEGQGNKVLLFVHGLGSYSPAWNKNIETLKVEYRCIALDLPGYGKSSKKAPVSLSFYVETLAALIEALSLEKPLLIGHSMGGQISITLAIKYPELIGGLVLAAPAGLEKFSEQDALTLKSFTLPAMIKNTADDKIKTNLMMNFYQMPSEEVMWMAEDRILMKQAPDFDDYCTVVSKCVAAMLDEPVADRLVDIELPVLLLYGVQDALIPNKFLHPALSTQQVAEEGAAKFQRAILMMIDKAGHFVQYEKSEEFNQAIRLFWTP